MMTRRLLLRLPIVAAFAAFAAGAQDGGPAVPPAAVDAGVATPPPPPTGPRSYVLDAKNTTVVIQVFKDGAAAAFAHDHTVHATEIAGELVVDPADLTTAKLGIVVQTKTLVNDDAQVRRQFGLDPTVPDKDKKAVLESMLGADQLDVGRHPTVAFKSTAVDKSGDKLTLVGDLTLHGQTRPVKMPISVHVQDDGKTVIGDGKVRFKQSDWGMKPYSAFLGAVKNKDELVLNVHLVATEKPLKP